MQTLALCHLWKEFGGKQALPGSFREWFTRKKSSGEFFPFLVEPAGKIETFYTLCPDPDDDGAAVLEGAEIGSLGRGSATRLPFNKPSGPNSPQLGPVIKRSYSKDGAGPKIVILNRTLVKFMEQADSGQAWAPYFKEVYELFSRKTLVHAGEVHGCDHNAFHEAVKRIPENKPVFLVAKDAKGRLPGDVPEYRAYLATMLDADKKYAIGKAKAVNIDACPCCGKKDVKGYPAGLSKAGVNISNMDREGAFPGISSANAHLSYAICEQCADLLYIFKFHVLDNYITYLAGQESLMLPELNLEPKPLGKFLTSFQFYLKDIQNADDSNFIRFEKKRLVHLLANQEATCTINILWSKDSLKGQSMGNLSGQILDVLPSRLRSIAEKNKGFDYKHLPSFPRHRTEGFMFDLNLSFVQELLRRPGGKKAKNVNKSQKLMELKRLLVEALYKGKNIPEERFWEEIMATAGWYLLDLAEKDKPEMDCLHEGYSEKKGVKWLTFAGWVRHLAMTLYYFDHMGVRERMENKRTYVPEMEKLKDFFGEECGINSDEKAFAFILGILYGRVMQVQGARGVNVGANALTWLKRLTLTGKDLPELYIKIREKLLSYDAEKSGAVRDVIKEAGTLGNKLGDSIVLSKTSCCYFLLLGQSLAADLFAADKKNS